MAASGGKEPALETVGNISNIAVGAATAVVEVAEGSGAGVVGAGSDVVGPGVLGTSDLDTLGQGSSETVTRRGTDDTILDHLINHGVGTRVDTSAGAGSVVGLHKTGVADTVACGASTNATLAFLHDNRKNESSVNQGLVGVLLDSLLDAGNLGSRVFGTHIIPATGVLHSAGSTVPERVPRGPVLTALPASADRTIAVSHGVGIAGRAFTLNQATFGGARGESSGDCRKSESDESVHFDEVGRLKDWLENQRVVRLNRGLKNDLKRL